MQLVTFKLQEGIVKKIDKLLRPLHFNNRTEFIREAIREKLSETEKDIVLLELEKFKGAAKVKTSDAEMRKIREEVGRKYAAKFGIKLD